METNLPDCRLTCLFGDWPAWTNTVMPEKIPKCLRPIRDHNAWSETNMSDGHQHDWLKTHLRPTCFIKHVQWVSNEACQVAHEHVGLRWGMLASDEACWSPMRHVGLRWGMSVSNMACRSLIRHVGLWWVSYQVCRSLMRHVCLC